MRDTIEERARQACMNSDSSMGLNCSSCANHEPCDFANTLVAFAKNEVASSVKQLREVIAEIGVSL